MSIASKCALEGCHSPIKTRGYCGAHYQKLRKLGAIKTHSQVIAEKGKMTDHKYYQRWSKNKSLGILCERWQDFWCYVDDVGDSNGCTKMLRLQETELFGPDNFKWAEELSGILKNRYYQREYRKASSNYKNKIYLRQYGISFEEYQEMFRRQNGRCAICGEEERRLVRKGLEEKRALAVDHCHKTGKIRALLCSDCNPSLGGFKDNIQTLLNAIEYLRKYECTE